MAGPLWGPNVMSADSADQELTLAWSAGGQASAIALSTTTANAGTQSVRCTYNGVAGSNFMVNNSTEIPVAASTAYYVSCWVFTNGTGLTMNLGVEWYTSGQAFINSVNTPTVAIPQNVWTPYPASLITTEATAAWLRINPQRIAGLASGNFVYFDTFRTSRLLALAVAAPMDLPALHRAALW